MEWQRCRRWALSCLLPGGDPPGGDHKQGHLCEHQEDRTGGHRGGIEVDGHSAPVRSDGRRLTRSGADGTPGFDGGGGLVEAGQEEEEQHVRAPIVNR